MRIATTREPTYYEAGQDMTGLDNPMDSYTQFISRVIREYESLALVFQFVTIDAERSIDEQHREVREHFERVQRRAWADWNIEPVVDWLSQSSRARLMV
jgi:hypothetical protein